MIVDLALDSIEYDTRWGAYRVCMFARERGDSSDQAKSCACAESLDVATRLAADGALAALRNLIGDKRFRG